MPYCTSDDLVLFLTRAKLAELSDDADHSDHTSAPAQAVIAAAIADADAEIDDALSSQFVVPVMVAPLPARLTLLSKQLASFYLFRRRREAGVPDEGKTPYEEVLKTLDAIRDGKQGVPGLTAKGLSRVSVNDVPAWVENFA